MSRRLTGVLLLVVIAIAGFAFGVVNSIRQDSFVSGAQRAEQNRKPSEALGDHSSAQAEKQSGSEHPEPRSTPRALNPKASSKSQTIRTDIKDYAFTKPRIKVKKGTKVTWTNRDTVGHNVMEEHQDGHKEHAAPSTDEVKADVFAGPLLASGKSYSFTFNKAGRYPYHCAPHPYMTGIVVVTD